MLRPTGPLFSGWNCVPHTLPRATAAVSGQLYSVVAITLSSQPVAAYECTH